MNNESIITYNDNYDRFISIPITNQQGQLMYNRAEKLYNSTPDYNLYAFICNHMAQTILSEANLNFTATSASETQEQKVFYTLFAPNKNLSKMVMH